MRRETTAGARGSGQLRVWIALLGPVALALAGCETVPTEQLTAFSQSLTAVQEAEKPIFADLALAETRVSVNGTSRCAEDPPLLLPGGGALRTDFCLADARTAATIGDPPDTAAFRAGMTVLVLYTGTLTTLASGAGAAETSAKLNATAGSLLALAGPLLPGGAAFTGALAVLAPLVTQAAAQADKAEARRLILSGEAQVHALIGAERAAAPAIWNVVTGEWMRAARHLDPHDTAGAAALKARVEGYRGILANYVVMLDRLDAAWTATVAATRDPARTTLADLTVLTGQIKADAATLDRAFALLRAAPAR